MLILKTHKEKACGCVSPIVPYLISYH